MLFSNPRFSQGSNSRTLERRIYRVEGETDEGDAKSKQYVALARRHAIGLAHEDGINVRDIEDLGPTNDAIDSRLTGLGMEESYNPDYLRISIVG